MRIKRILEIDFILLLSVLALVVIGILFIYSSGISSSGAQLSNEFVKQIIWGATGFVFCLFISLLDYRRLYTISLYIYLGFLVILIYTIFFGRLVNGARAWIGIGSFGIQPSEFTKIATILVLARYLEQTKNANNLKRYLFSIVIVMVPAGLVLLQPDLGTALVFIPILLGMCFIAGVKKRYITYTILFIALTSLLTVFPLWHMYILKNKYQFLNVLSNPKAILLVSGISLSVFLISLWGYIKYKKNYFFNLAYYFSIISGSMLFSLLARSVLKEYQIMRLIVFLDPQIDPRGSGWNIIQSTTAIGSGGLWGKGFLQGTQSHYRFLPQQSTDFIFSIFSEEWGFAGGLIVFFLFGVILYRCISIIKTSSDNFGTYIVSGVAAMIFFHYIINVGMTMGIMPITGIPLIFMSYGGSSLWASFISIGFVLAAYTRRFDR